MVRRCFFNDFDARVLQQHFHANEKWFGAQVNNQGPGSQNSLTPFEVVSAATANTFGSAIVVFDGSETPIEVGMQFFDVHQLSTIDAQFTNKTYRLRIANSANGESSFAEAVANFNFSDVVFSLTTNVSQAQPIGIRTPLLPSHTKLWAALATLDAVAQYLQFTVGIHEQKG